MQALQSSLIGHYSLSMSVSVAFHYIILKDSCLLPHKYVPLTSLRVTVINALLRIGCQIRCQGKSRLKWMKWNGSRRLNRSSCCLKDRGMAASHLRGFKCFFAGSVCRLCHCDRKTHSGNITTPRPKGREKSPLFWQDVCQMLHSHTTSAQSCINKLQASSGKQTFLLEVPATGHHMCLLR